MRTINILLPVESLSRGLRGSFETRLKDLLDGGHISTLPTISTRKAHIKGFTVVELNCADPDHSVLLGFYLGFDLVRANPQIFRED